MQDRLEEDKRMSLVMSLKLSWSCGASKLEKAYPDRDCVYSDRLPG